MTSFKDSVSVRHCYVCGGEVDATAHFPLVVWSFLVASPIPFHRGCCPGEGTESCRQCSKERRELRAEEA